MVKKNYFFNISVKLQFSLDIAMTHSEKKLNDNLFILKSLINELIKYLGNLLQIKKIENVPLGPSFAST